jgi:hypothetical protein
MTTKIKNNIAVAYFMMLLRLKKWIIHSCLLVEYYGILNFYQLDN